jgi:hypothetical protein
VSVSRLIHVLNPFSVHFINPHTTHMVFRDVNVESHCGADEVAKLLLLVSLFEEKTFFNTEEESLNLSVDIFGILHIIELSCIGEVWHCPVQLVTC